MSLTIQRPLPGLYLELRQLRSRWGKESQCNAIDGLCECSAIVFDALREFLGPLVSGALAEVLDFQTSAMVSQTVGLLLFHVL